MNFERSEFVDNSSTYVDITTRCYSVMPQDGADWDDDTEEAVFENVIVNLEIVVTELFKDYKNSSAANSLDADGFEIDTVFNVTADHFNIGYSYIDNGLYGAEIEVTLYENFLDELDNKSIEVYSTGEILNEAASYLEDALNNNIELIQDALNDALQMHIEKIKFEVD